MRPILASILLFFLLFNCSSDDDSPAEEQLPPEPITAAFNSTISSVDPNTLLVSNTTTYEFDFTSTWDFGLDNGAVTDVTGTQTVRYDAPGTYTITLTVTAVNGVTDTATATVVVDGNGICPDNTCVTIPPVEETNDGSGLKDLADFSVGMAITRARLNVPQHAEILRNDFNNLTAEFEMKMDIMHPTPTTFDFSAGDAIVDFAIANGMNVHGHTLIWHNEFAIPDWVKNFSGTNAEFEAMVENYITTTLRHFRGRVRSWDIVNEAISDSRGNPLRNTEGDGLGSIFRQKMGPDYVRKCFQYARNADPDVLLFYNDYNLALSTGKRAAMFRLVDELGDLIDGVGAQMHISFNSPSRSRIQDLANGVVSRNLLLHFAELDIRVNTEGNASLTGLSTSRANAQKAKYQEVVEIYDAIPEANKFALTVWGLRDNETWLTDFWRVPEFPLLFDANYNTKASYDGFAEALAP
jgi:endo-1,4-beta-xylanase